VYEAARVYFGLPDVGPKNLFLEDARAWAAKRAATSNNILYDLIVHDCFSGGGIPEHIYTIEFWNDLRAVMHPEGILVVVGPLYNLCTVACLARAPEFCRTGDLGGIKIRTFHS
jgi:spermidine synthase